MIFCVFQVFKYAAHAFFYISSTFISNTRLKLAKKIKQRLNKQHPDAKLLLSENYLLSLFKNNIAYSKKCTKKQLCLFVYFNEII